MKNISSILKKLLSTLCIVLMVSVVFSTVVKNASADEVYGFLSDFTDTDDDGLSDWEEAAKYGTNWRDPDCDDDGLLDGEEINTYGTDPNNPDTDNDGILDGFNVTLDISDSHEYYLWLSDDWQNKYYHDGYTFLGELSYGTNNNNSDTDNDEMRDGWEAYYGTKPTDFDSGEDPDYDNLTNIQEWENKTHPTNPDTDFDALLDFDEIVMGTDPLCSDSDNDGLIDGVDNQPMAWWDMGWEQPGKSLSEAYYTYKFAVLAKRWQDYPYYNGSYKRPPDEDIIKALQEQYSKEVQVDYIKFLEYRYSSPHIPPEIAPKKSVFDDAQIDNIYEYLFEIRASHIPNIRDCYSTMFEWVLEPNADQKINLQITLSKRLDDSRPFGFVASLYKLGPNGGWEYPPYSSFSAVCQNLSEDNTSYQTSIQIPWNCVPATPQTILVELSPMFLNYTIGVNGSVKEISPAFFNVSKYGLKIASIQGEIIKNPYLIAVNPKLNFTAFIKTIPENITTFYTNNATYQHLNYSIQQTYYDSQKGFWGPICTKNITNATTKEHLGFVVISKFKADIESYKNISSYLWSNLSPEKLPCVNMSSSYETSLFFPKELCSDTNDTVLPYGNASIVKPQPTVNYTMIYVVNDTILGLYFYMHYNLEIAQIDPTLESFSVLRDTCDVIIAAGIYQRMEYSKNLRVSSDKAWVGTKITGNVLTLAVIVFTASEVTIAIQKGNYFEAALYTAGGALVVGGIQISKSTTISPKLGYRIGIAIAVALFVLEVTPVAMKLWNAQSGEFKMVYGLVIVREAMIFTTSMVVGWAVGIVVSAVATPFWGAIACIATTMVVDFLLHWLVDTGWCDLDTPQGIVVTILLGPLGWVAAWIQESEEEIEATVKGRLSEWWRNRQLAGEMPLIIW